MQQFVGAYDVDALARSRPAPAPLHGCQPGDEPLESYVPWSNVMAHTMAGVPVAVVPAGTERGLPLGVHIAAAPFAEQVALAAAAARRGGPRRLRGGERPALAGRAADEAAVLAAAAESPYTRRPDPGTTTESLLADAFTRVLAAAGLTCGDVDGLGVASFTLRPDHAIDLAWRLGLRLRWLMEDTNGGAAAVNMLQHAARAVEAGDAETIVLLAGDRLLRESSARSSTPTTGRPAITSRRSPGSARTRCSRSPHGVTWPRTGLDARGLRAVAVAQRRWAAGNPGAVYREPLTLAEYLAAPVVAEPLHATTAYRS